MLHAITWSVQKHWSSVLISNELFGIEAMYQWSRESGQFFLFPLIDERSKTVLYYAFDAIQLKQTFTHLMKINGIWPKTAYMIAHLDQTILADAVERLDVQYISSLPGIWPKTAKKILLELKDTIKPDDIAKLMIDKKLLTSITKTLKQFGYTSDQISHALSEYQGELKQEFVQDIITWLVKHIKL